MTASVPKHFAAPPLDMRYAFLLCIALSLATHLLLLKLNTLPEPLRSIKYATSATNRALQIGVISNAPGIAAVKPTSDLRHSTPFNPQPLPIPAPTTDQIQPEATVVSEDAAPGLSSEIAAQPASNWDTERYHYVPRPLLTVPPIAQDPVILGTPKGLTGVAKWVGVFSLFIDEDGRVQHITADDPPLPLAFEQVALNTFMGTRFTPGQIAGQAVKSRLRIEVVFDNTPLERPN